MAHRNLVHIEFVKFTFLVVGKQTEMVRGEVCGPVHARTCTLAEAPHISLVGRAT